MRSLSNCLRLLSLLLFLLGQVQCCQDKYCSNCNTYLNSGTIMETCFECSSGYSLNDSGTGCIQNAGLIIGIAIGAAAAIVVQIVVYIICRVKFNEINKKRTEVSLEEIYREEKDGEGGEGGEGGDGQMSDSLKT